MRKILFVDDDATQMKYHVKRLRKSFEIEVRGDVKRAFETFEASPEGWAGVILDVMMPPGDFEAATPNGMQTGWFLLKQVREIDSQLPVLVLTNARNIALKQAFEAEPHVKVIEKLLITPETLLREAEQFFGSDERF
jgi:CheY-like chemotaxis protein